MSASILLVDDDVQALESTKKILTLSGFQVTTAADGQEALEFLSDAVNSESIELVLTDVRMPRMTGLEFLQAVSVARPGLPVVLMTAYGKLEDAVWAMKLGAVDFLSKPFKRQALLDAVQVALKRKRGSRAASAPKAVEGARASVDSLVMGEANSMRELRRSILQVAGTTATVLIQGESGTGKERVARALHEASPRAKQAFVAINCAALPENLLESELFGYERGAFTGANAAKPGLLEAAHGGTLLLDEIGDMPLSLQAKLLRVLQEGEVRRVGGTSPRKVDVRIIAASHRDLRSRAEEGAFRQDLLFRLEVVTLKVPALRERREDVPLLALHFLAEFSRRHGKSISRISNDCLSALEAHLWPGNVRELQNVIERAVVFCGEAELSLADLPPHLLELAGRDLGLTAPAGSISIPLGTPLKDVEELLIKKTLEATRGDKGVTAKLLGINSRTIYRKLKGEDAKGEDVGGGSEPSG